jgi:hypothetical protein
MEEFKKRNLIPTEKVSLTISLPVSNFPRTKQNKLSFPYHFPFLFMLGLPFSFSFFFPDQTTP